MKTILKSFYFILAMMFIIQNVAHAHSIGGNGLGSGLTHPLLGLDHLLAMLAVGIISVQIGGRAVWKVPATFVIFMIIGAVLAFSGIRMPAVETAISLSVLFFGVLITLSKKIPISFALLSVAVFALFHGHAHGEEFPVIGNPVLYGIGFVLSTITLHVTGVLIGYFAIQKNLTRGLLRYAGVALSVIGFIFLIRL